MPAAAPSAFNTHGTAASPAISATQYDPRTGYYAAPDGQTYRQAGLAGNAPQSWQDLIFRGGS
jgi:hypothetical protein